MHARTGFAALAGASLALAVLASARPADAQTPRFERGEPAQITADAIEYFKDRDVYVADGNVRVVQGDRELEARWAAFGATTRIGVASGDVVYRAEGEAVTARFLEFDVDTLDGVVFGANLDMGETGFRIAAEELVRTGEDRYRIRGARFTACRCPDEHDRLPWELHAESSNVHLGGYGTSCNTTVEVLGVPVIWLPWMMYPVKTERQTGLLVPDVSFGNRNGLQVGLPLFWAARENVNVLVTPRYSTVRGYKQDLEIETVYGERSRTLVRGAYLHDEASVQDGDVPRELDRPGDPVGSTEPAIRDRGYVAVEHDQDLPLGVRFKADGAWTTDNQYALDFQDLEGHRRDRYLEANAFAMAGLGGDDRFVLQAAGSYANDLQGRDGQDRDDFLLQRYGDLEAQWLSGPVLGQSWLSSALDVDYEFFGREHDPARVLVGGTTDLIGDRFYDVGIGAIENLGAPGAASLLFDEGEPLADRGHRLTVHPRIGIPLRLFDAIEWFSEGGYRETLYWSDLQGYEENGRITGRSEMSLRFVRSFERDGAASIEHELVPHIGWAFVDSERGQQTNPLFTPQAARLQDRVRQQTLDTVVLDRADVVESANRLVVGVRNRFSIGDGPTRRYAGEFGIAFDGDLTQEQLGNVVVEGRGIELWRARTRFLVAFDVEQEFDIAEGLAEMWLPLIGRASLLARYRYLRDAPQFFEQFQSLLGASSSPESFDRISQLSGGVYVPILDRVILQYRATYSFEGTRFLTNAVTVDYVSKCGCWAAGIELSDVRNQGLQARFRYTILGLGDDLSNPFAKRQGWFGGGP